MKVTFRYKPSVQGDGHTYTHEYTAEELEGMS